MVGCSIPKGQLVLQAADCTAMTHHTRKDSQEPRITKIYVPGQHSSNQSHRSAVSQQYWLETSHSLIGKKSLHSAHCTTWAVSEITETPDVHQPWLMLVPDSQSSHSNSTPRDALLSLLQHPRIGAHQCAAQHCRKSRDVDTRWSATPTNRSGVTAWTRILL